MQKNGILALAYSVLLLSGCASLQQQAENHQKVGIVSFHYVAGHVITVPVRIDGNLESTFILDTGAGLNLITKELNDKLGLKASSSYTGRRMSGQSLSIPLTQLRSLSIGSIELKDTQAGVFDGLPPELKLGGLISLRAFENRAVTYDYRNSRIIIEDAESLARRVAEGVSVPIRLARHGPELDIFLHLVLPDKSIAEVEVDTGSSSLILDDRFRSKLKVVGGSKALKRYDGKDETNYQYTRYFGKLEGLVHVEGAPSVGQTNPPVQFQKIIYDGLVGDAFLRQFQVTYDLPNSRMIFKK